MAAGLFGDGLWTNIGLVIRVEISRTIFSQTVSNEVMQRMGQSSFQAFATANVSMTLRQFQVEHMAALYPGISKNFQPVSNSRNEGFGHSINASVIQPVGLHIRPQSAMGQPGNNGTCWWVPAAVASEELGTFIYKLENTNEANEDYTLTFGASLLDRDYAATSQTIADGGQILYRGDTRHIVTNSWEEGLPFGYVQGTPGRVTTLTSSTSGGSFTLTWTAPASDYIDNDNPITGYKVRWRRNGTGAWTDVDIASAATLTSTVSSTSGHIVQARVAPVSAAGVGQFAELDNFITVA